MSQLLPLINRSGLIGEQARLSVTEHCQHTNESLPKALDTLGLLNATELAEFISDKLALPFVHIDQFNYQQLCQSLGLRELISQYHALPLETKNNKLIIGVADPTLAGIVDDFRFATGMFVELRVCKHDELSAAIRRLYGHQSKNKKTPLSNNKDINENELIELVDLVDEEKQNLEEVSSDDSPVSRFINQVLNEAIRKNASDIHFEPYEHNYRIRFRCDGVLIPAGSPSIKLSRRIAARLKILARLDIAERRLPQDGRIKLTLNKLDAIDLRVSTLPTLWGEKIVLRILDGHQSKLSIEHLGFSEQQQALYLKYLNKSQGMILVTGPTGSGKTVSLYTGLEILNQPEVNISTAEDPIEINIEGINQVQTQPKIELTFANILRAFLRQDPDVIMVGEIRDLETAQIAIAAAQTGHLLLSTLHTNSAVETITRLKNMGIKPYELASSLSLIIAQRIVRKLCVHCKQKDQLTNIKAQLERLDQHQLAQSLLTYQNAQPFKANGSGCHHCNNGYLGRTGVYECLPMTPKMIDAIISEQSVRVIEQIAEQEGMISLAFAGLNKWAQGVTSFSELKRVLNL